MFFGRLRLFRPCASASPYRSYNLADAALLLMLNWSICACWWEMRHFFALTRRFQVVPSVTVHHRASTHLLATSLPFLFTAIYSLSSCFPIIFSKTAISTASLTGRYNKWDALHRPSSWRNALFRLMLKLFYCMTSGVQIVANINVFGDVNSATFGALYPQLHFIMCCE